MFNSPTCGIEVMLMKLSPGWADIGAREPRDLSDRQGDPPSGSGEAWTRLEGPDCLPACWWVHCRPRCERRGSRWRLNRSWRSFFQHQLSNSKHWWRKKNTKEIDRKSTKKLWWVFSTVSKRIKIIDESELFFVKRRFRGSVTKTFFQTSASNFHF